MRPLTLVLFVATLPAQTREAPPEARSGHALAYDPGRKRVLLVNGDHPTASAPGEVRGFNGERWAVLDAKAPPARTLSATAFDSKRNRLVVHGGLGLGDLVHDDTLEWDGKDWHRTEAQKDGPGVRNHHAAAFDSERNVVVIFGGTEGDPGPYLWKRTTWRRAASGTVPPGRSHHAMAYDAARDRVVVFGGCAGNENLADTWERDGEGRWSRIDAK